MGDKRPFRTTRSLASLRQGRDDWYKIQASDGGSATQLMIYDEISWWGISAQQLTEQLAGITGDLEVHLNSPGGDVFDGIAIMNALKQHNGQVTVMVDGLAASVASVIAMAAAPGQLIMCPGSMMMIHDAWGMSIGNAADMREMADLLDKASGNVADIYAARSGKPASDWRAAMTAETWYKAQEAVDAGLADRIRSADDPAQVIPAADNSWDLSVFASWPGRPAAAAAWQHGVHDAAVDESDWDGPAAMSAAAKSDDPAAAYAAICAGRKDGDADKQSSWALPHHKHKGDPPNADGVRNALSRLPQTDGLTNEAAARAHLNAHMADIGQDDDPSNRADMPAWLRDDA